MSAEASELDIMRTNLDPQEYYKNGVYSYNHGKYADANMYFEKAIELSVKTKDDKKKLALLWNSKGMALEALGSHIENQCNQFTDEGGRMDTINPYHTDNLALEAFEAAISFKSGVAHTYMANIYRNQGYTCAKRGWYEKAIACFKNADAEDHLAADAADPMDIADTYRNIGYAIAKESYCAENPSPLENPDYQKAIFWLEKSTKLCPNFALAWNTKGYIHTMFEQYDEARKCFLRAIRIDPDFARAWRNYGYVLYCMERDKQLRKDLGPDEIYENAIELDTVIDCLSKAIELDFHDPYAWHYRAHVYFRKGEYDNALRDFDKAIQIRFSLYDAWYGKGMVLESKGLYEEARECFDRAIKWCTATLDKGKENQHIGESNKLIVLKKLAFMYNSKGMSLVNFADSLPKNEKNQKKSYLANADESFDDAIEKLQNIQNKSGINIETDLGIGLALYNKGYLKADSVVDDYTKGPLELKRQYEYAIDCLNRAIYRFKKSQRNLKQEDLVNNRLCSRYIADTWRNQGFLHAKLAELSSDKEIKQKEHKIAFECYEKSTRDYSFALAWNSRGYHIIGFLEDLKKYGSFNRNEEIKKAKECFRNAIKSSRRNKKYNSEYLAYFHYNLGYSYFTSGSDEYYCKKYNEAKENFDKAASYLEDAISFQHEYADAWFVRAISLYYSENSEKPNKGEDSDDSNITTYTNQKYNIIKYLDKSIALYQKDELYKKGKNTNFAYAWYYKGILLTSLGRYEEAVKCLDEATYLNYDFGEAWYRKGLVLYSMQNYKLAIECFDNVSTRNGEYTISDSKLLLMKGRSKYYAGELSCAKKDLKAISDEILDKNVISQKYLTLGLIAHERGELKSAKDLYEIAEKYDDSDDNLAEVNYNLARLYSGLNENNKAKESLDKCIRASDGSPNKEMIEKAREAENKFRESRHTQSRLPDWYQWWIGGSKGKKIAGIALIVALMALIISPLIVIDRAILHLMNSSSTGFTTFITSGVTAQTIAVFTLAVGALLAILLLPSLQKFRAGGIELETVRLETVSVIVKDQVVMPLPQPPKISPPSKDEMPHKITAQYFRMPLRYQIRMQVYTPIDPTPAPTKYKKILLT